MNVYYHFYSGERPSPLKALKIVYDYVLKQPTTPVYASRYTDVVMGFVNGEITKRSDGGWDLSNYGQCQTVRIDAKQGYPDLSRSTGILGFKKWNDFHYLHLSEEGEVALYLTQEAPTHPYLVEASVVVDSLSLTANDLSFKTKGIGKGTITFANLSPSTEWEITVNGHSLPSAKSSTKGELTLALPLSGPTELIVAAKGKR